MIRAATGGMLNVSGSSIAMVASGPMPGKTPIRVPRKQPMKQYRRFCRENATPNPKIRLIRCSMSLSPSESLEQRIGQAKTPDEHSHRKEDQHNGNKKNLAKPELPARGRRPENQDRQGRDETRVLHQNAEQDHGQRQNDQGPQRPTTLDLFAVEQPPDHDVDPEPNEAPPQKTRKVARPHPQRRPERVAPGRDHRRRAARDEHRPGPKVPVVAKTQFHRALLVSRPTIPAERPRKPGTPPPPLPTSSKVR